MINFSYESDDFDDSLVELAKLILTVNDFLQVCKM